jgi:hypothetical protein
MRVLVWCVGSVLALGIAVASASGGFAWGLKTSDREACEALKVIRSFQPDPRMPTDEVVSRIEALARIRQVCAEGTVVLRPMDTPSQRAPSAEEEYGI